MRRKIAKTSVLLTTQADENAVICKGYPFDPNGALARRDTRLASNRRRIRDGISTNPGGEIFSLTGWVSLVGQAKENRMKYIIQYVLPYEHRVRVGIQAESEEDALAKAEDLFHEGVLCLDSRSVPLLYDDFEEQGDSGVALEFTVEATAGDWPEPDASVKEIRRQAAAFRAARLLVEAYRIGEERGGSIEWDELDQAYQAALQAFPELSATITGIQGA